MSNFRPIDRYTPYLLPPSVEDWLPERHLARFVVEIIDQLDLSAMSGAYRGSGSASYHPRLLVALLVYGYATSVFSSRKLERATYDSVAFRFVAANQHPDHDTIAAFRKRGQEPGETGEDVDAVGAGMQFVKSIGGLPTDLLMVGRALSLLDGITKQLDPDMDIVELAARYAETRS